MKSFALLLIQFPKTFKEKTCKIDEVNIKIHIATQLEITLFLNKPLFVIWLLLVFASKLLLHFVNYLPYQKNLSIWYRMFPGFNYVADNSSNYFYKLRHVLHNTAIGQYLKPRNIL